MGEVMTTEQQNACDNVCRDVLDLYFMLAAPYQAYGLIPAEAIKAKGLCKAIIDNLEAAYPQIR